MEPAAAATCGVVGTSLRGMWTWPAAVLALALTAAPTVAVAVSLALGLVLCLSAFAIATAAHACGSGATHGVTFHFLHLINSEIETNFCSAFNFAACQC